MYFSQSVSYLCVCLCVCVSECVRREYVWEWCCVCMCVLSMMECVDRRLNSKNIYPLKFSFMLIKMETIIFGVRVCMRERGEGDRDRDSERE